jgi:hypothetical protein
LQGGAAHVHAADFRLRLLRARPVAGFVPQPQTNPRPRPPGPAGPLVGRRPRDGNEPQPVHADGRLELQLPRQAGVHDRGHALDRHRRFSDVRGQHDLAAGELLQRMVLLLGRQVAVERQDFRVHAGEVVGGVADLAEAGEEREHVAVGECERLAHAVRGGAARAVQHLDGEAAAGAVHDGGAAEVRGHRPGVDRRRHHDRGQVRPDGLADELHHAEGQVGVEAALVELVEHHSPDVLQERVVVEAPQQDAGGDDEDAGVRPGGAVEPDLVAEHVAEGRAVLVRHPPGRGPRGDAPRLQHHDGTGNEVEQRRGDAGGFAGAGRRAEDGGPRRADGGEQRGEGGVDRQRLAGHGYRLTSD